ncbi:DEKNAAC103068 [Brettanomyces naardenensis]|uniref:DEKNAAC103068 n=1 Tax=Brettanomyces naardenensis TaxID=13370 RepID=A0A448YMA2_BRENA|nr:DEKNAAC103068 [Brettanomyces naardenensis]
MSKITDKINQLSADEPFFSFEFFPPKTEHGTRNLYARLGRMSLMGPLFVTVTWGAGGTTAEKSLGLAITCQKELGLTTCLHLTCTNTTREVIDEALHAAKANGIRNILALRGDPSREASASHGLGEFEHAVDLVKYIRKQYGNYFCIGVAGYPEGHADGFYDASQNPKKDMPFLVEKINAGADFVLTQLFFDVDSFLSFNKLLRSQPDLRNKDITVIPGLMPINNYGVFQRATKLSHASIPDSVLDRFDEEIQNDDDKVKEIGVSLINEMIKEIYEKTDGKIKGFHFYTLNLEKSIAQIVNQSPILSKVVEKKEKELEQCVSDSSDDDIDDSTTTAKRAAYMNRFKQPTNQIIVDSKKDLIKSAKMAAGQAQQYRRSSSSQFQKIMSISSGHGTLGKDATWDDHPNGRFGDTRSPAYGTSSYGPSLNVTSVKAYELWGQPADLDGISNIFVSYLSRQIDSIPWNEMSINPETAVIQEQLIELNKAHMFTMSSQPASNCAGSNDKIFGWGPSHGYVYQKAFVEMFVSKEDWEKKLLPKLKDNPEVSYYVGDNRKYFASSMKAQDTNCITWGVFPDRQIVQTTIVGEDTFKAWKEEGFEIWREWMLLYPRGSPSANVIKNVLDNYYLTTIVHHNYPDENALWRLILGEDED